MATYTLNISVCSGGNHITTAIKKNGTTVKTVLLNKQEVLDTVLSDDEIGAIVTFLMRSAIKKANAVTPLQMKQAVESTSWEF